MIKYFSHCNTTVTRCFSTNINGLPKNQFEAVFSLPHIKYLSIFNRLKVYQFVGSSIAIPSCAVLGFLNVVSQQTFLSTTYVGITAGAVLSLASLPFNNVIGFLYVNEDNSLVKISVLNFWGKRKDKIIPTSDWIPLNDMDPKLTDPFYLTPQLIDGTKYKLLHKFGKVLNAQKMGEVLE